MYNVSPRQGAAEAILAMFTDRNDLIWPYSLNENI